MSEMQSFDVKAHELLQRSEALIFNAASPPSCSSRPSGRTDL